MPYEVADWIAATDIADWMVAFAGIIAVFAVIYISFKQIAIQKRQMGIQEAQVDFQRRQINIMKLQVDITRKLIGTKEGLKNIEKEQTDTAMQQTSAVNIATQQWEMIQANLIAQIELRLDGDPAGDFLLVKNEGPADARDVTMRLDGCPLSKHRNVRTSLPDTIQKMAAGAIVEYSLNFGNEDLRTLSLDIRWMDNSSESRCKSTTLRVF